MRDTIPCAACGKPAHWVIAADTGNMHTCTRHLTHSLCLLRDVSGGDSVMVRDLATYQRRQQRLTEVER